MKHQKYQSIKIISDVNCSSTGHYHVRISYNVVSQDGRRTHRTTWYSLDVASNLPKYAIDEIKRLLRGEHERGELKVFEYDRDGNKRYDVLFYHYPEYFLRLIGFVVPVG